MVCFAVFRSVVNCDHSLAEVSLPLLAIACRFHKHVLTMTVIFFVTVDSTEGIQILVAGL